MGMLLTLIQGLLFASHRVPPQVNYKKEHTDALRKRWSAGTGEETDGIAIDYSFYSPVDNGADPAEKYPLVVIMAGALEGIVKGFELEANSLAMWSDPVLQARFHNGGAFLLIGRAPEERRLYWDSAKVIPPFRTAVDGFIAAHPNVDTERIYTVGWCLGGTGATNLLSTYPGFFAAGIIITPGRAVTAAEAAALCDTPVWMMGCRRDNYVSYKKIIQRSEDRLLAAHNAPEDLRFTASETAPDVFLAGVLPFINDHDLWDDLAEDMHPEKPQAADIATVDGAGHVIEDPYAISWLCGHTNAGRDKDKKYPVVKDKTAALYEKYRVPQRGRSVLFLLRLLHRLGYIDLKGTGYVRE